MIHVDAHGENAITIVAGANGDARAAQVPDSALGPGTTLMLQLEVPMAEVAMLARRARGRGVRVMLNAAPAAAVPDDLLRWVDVLIVNESEAARIGAEHGLPAMPEDFAAVGIRAIRLRGHRHARAAGRAGRTRRRAHRDRSTSNPSGRHHGRR